MTTSCNDKHIVITGASGGLGTAVVQAFLTAGAICYLPLRPGTTIDDMPWAANERAIAKIGIDLTEESTVESYYQSLPGLWGSIHLVGGFTMASVLETTVAEFERMIALNAKTCFLCCRAAVKSMRQTGEGGRIVNVTARPVLQPTGGMLAYTTSKAAVAAITNTLAVELRDDRILVNAVIPSLIDTPQNRTAMPDADFASWPQPEEIAESIGFLASPQNRLTSGCLLPVYGRA